MANTKVVVSIPTMGKRQEAELPDDVPMRRLIPALITKMGLPTTDPTGQAQSYRFNHIRSGRQLGEDDTLDSAGVQANDELKMSVEVQPGGYYGSKRYF